MIATAGHNFQEMADGAVNKQIIMVKFILEKKIKHMPFTYSW